MPDPHINDPKPYIPPQPFPTPDNREVIIGDIVESDDEPVEPVEPVKH